MWRDKSWEWFLKMHVLFALFIGIRNEELNSWNHNSGFSAILRVQMFEYSRVEPATWLYTAGAFVILLLSVSPPQFTFPFALFCHGSKQGHTACPTGGFYRRPNVVWIRMTAEQWSWQESPAELIHYGHPGIPLWIPLNFHACREIIDPATDGSSERNLAEISLKTLYYPLGFL